MEYYVIKRDGRKTTYHSEKISNALLKAADDLDVPVDVSFITAEVEKRMQDTAL